MRRSAKLGVLFVTTILLSTLLGAWSAWRTPTASKEDDKQAAINVVLAHEEGVQAYDFDKVDSLHTPDARVIEESFPHPFEPDERQGWQVYKDAGVHVEYHPQDAAAEVRGDVAWVTLTLHSSWRADTPAGRAMIGGEWHVTFVESFILVKTPEGWKITFRHTSQLPADFGVDPDYQAEHGGMKLLKVSEDGPAGKAGLKSGDVLIEYGERKIDNYSDYGRLVHAYSEGEKVMVTVIRGHEKITKEVTLGQMQ